MHLDSSVIEILELDKNLLPFRENLRGELGELVLSNLPPCEDFDSLIKRDDLLREWLDLIDSNGEFKFNASLEAVSPMFASAKRSGILSGEELLRVRLLLQSARNLRESLAPIIRAITITAISLLGLTAMAGAVGAGGSVGAAAGAFPAALRS